ncbi:XkdX family protein [Bacillus cereus]|nr:XkdX family protein [Bacillus cereus]
MANENVTSPNFLKWKKLYEKEWCTNQQLCKLVDLEQITVTEYKTLTKLEYPNVQ